MVSTGQYIKEDNDFAEAVPTNLSIAVDYQGDLWLTADGGATRYDGHSWTTFTAKDGLADNWVNDITIDDTGKVWFATDSGLSSFDGSKWASYSTRQGLPHKRINTVTFHDHALWLSTEYPVSSFGVTKYEGGGITRFDPTTATFITYTTDNGLASNYVSTIAFDSTGNVWVASLYSDRGVSRFDGKTWVNYTTSEGLISNTINNIAVDSNGNIWFGAFGRTGNASELVLGSSPIQPTQVPHSINAHE